MTLPVYMVVFYRLLKEKIMLIIKSLISKIFNLNNFTTSNNSYLQVFYKSLQQTCKKINWRLLKSLDTISINNFIKVQ